MDFLIILEINQIMCCALSLSLQVVSLHLFTSTLFLLTLYPANYCSTPKVGNYCKTQVCVYVCAKIKNSSFIFVCTDQGAAEERTNDNAASEDKSKTGRTK